MMTERCPALPAGGEAGEGIQSTRYAVTVDGRPIDVHGARSCKAPWPFRCFKAGEHPDIKLASPDAPAGVAQVAPGGNAPYAFAGFPVDGPTTVTVTGQVPLDRAAVRPAGAGVVKAIEGNALALELDRPTKLSIEPAGRHGGLLLFADAPETDVPDADDPKVHFYGPGVHRAGVIELQDDETLYLARGAIVEGGVSANGAKNIRIMGRGILCGNPWGWRDGPQPHMLMLNACENVLIEGITIRCSWQWTIRPFACKHVTIRNVKLCCGKNLNDDGIDPDSSQDVLIEHCFVRTQDDCISIKGHCDDRRNCERITIRHCLFWSDLSRVLMVGPESHCDRIGDILMQDCEVLHVGPPINKAGFGAWAGCAPTFCIEAGEDSLMENIRIENVRVAVDSERELVLIEPTINKFMRRRTPGNIRDVCFVNLDVTGTPCRLAIRIKGWDQRYTVRGVRFERCRLFGNPLRPDHGGIEIGDYTKEISFT